jgi:hypothetical protein
VQKRLSAGTSPAAKDLAVLGCLGSAEAPFRRDKPGGGLEHFVSATQAPGPALGPRRAPALQTTASRTSCSRRACPGGCGFLRYDAQSRSESSSAASRRHRRRDAAEERRRGQPDSRLVHTPRPVVASDVGFDLVQPNPPTSRAQAHATGAVRPDQYQHKRRECFPSFLEPVPVPSQRTPAFRIASAMAA